VFKCFGIWQNLFPHVFNYFELCIVKTMLGEMVLGKGLHYTFSFNNIYTFVTVNQIHTLLSGRYLNDVIRSVCYGQHTRVGSVADKVALGQAFL
jgi:hypothetical protein